MGRVVGGMTAVLACAQLPDYFEFKADIPGQSKDKISVTVDGHRLHIAVVSPPRRCQINMMHTSNTPQALGGAASYAAAA